VDVCLTFDDGPHPQATGWILDILAEHQVQAVFFLVGEQVRQWPRVAARIGAEGHVVGVHCDRHRSLLRLSPGQVASDLDRAVAAIEHAGLQAECYRPPYGVISTAGLLIARRRAWPIWLWDCDGRDWLASASAAAVSARILRSISPGATVLLHDSPAYCRRRDWRVAPHALEAILEGLAVQGIAVERRFETAPGG
jgi:peptidoglycan-N-acetylglucosamine deacetylase